MCMEDPFSQIRSHVSVHSSGINCPLEYLPTTLLSLLFIHTIPINFKNCKNFPYTCLLTNYVAHTASKEEW